MTSSEQAVCKRLWSNAITIRAAICDARAHPPVGIADCLVLVLLRLICLVFPSSLTWLLLRGAPQGEDTDPAAISEIREAVRNGSEASVRLLNYKKSGKPFWNMFTLAPMADVDGNLRFIIGVQVTFVTRHRIEGLLVAHSIACTSPAVRASARLGTGIHVAFGSRCHVCQMACTDQIATSGGRAMSVCPRPNDSPSLHIFGAPGRCDSSRCISARQNSSRQSAGSCNSADNRDDQHSPPTHGIGPGPLESYQSRGGSTSATPVVVPTVEASILPSIN